MHVHARLHAFFHGLFRPSEATLTREVHDAVVALAERHRVANEDGRQALATRIATDACSRVGGNPDTRLVGEIAKALLDYEDMFVVPAY
jgi:hypothetical protein